MSSPSSAQRRRSRVLVASPFNANRRRSGRLSISKPKTSNVKVCIRVRPRNATESGYREGKEVVEVMDDHVLVFDPVVVHTPSFHRGRPTRDPTAKRNRDIKFGFGRVFDAEATNEDVFDETTREALDSLMKGINCSVFAYGATGAGKTFTMLGTTTNRGVIARTVDALYERIDSIKEHTICDVEVSYLEIYNETVRDLLNPTGQELMLREGGNGVAVPGLSFYKPANVDELYKMLETGNANRTQHPTDANKESSRSHAVFHIYLKQKNRTADISTDIVMSKMALIDLAGSERAAATANNGARMREGANINRSLLSLGNCINALAEGKKGNHIPYRDSKLTRILKDSLGGNCQTVMIAAVSPSALAYDDTHNTLKYADRAQKIKLDLKSNVYRVNQHVHQYGKIVDQLQAEIEELKNKVESLENDKRKLKKQLQLAEASRQSVQQPLAPAAAAAPPVPPPQIVDVVIEKKAVNGLLLESQLEEMVDVVKRYMEMQNDLLDSENQRRILQLKIQHRVRSQDQLNEVQFESEKKEMAKIRLDKYLTQNQNRLNQLSTHIDRTVEQMTDMKKGWKNQYEKWVSSQQSATNGHGRSDFDANKLIVDAMIDRSLLCQLMASEHHLKAVIECMNTRMEQQDRAIEMMGPLLKEQHLLLKSYKNLTTTFNDRFEQVEKLLEAGKAVGWRDQNASGNVTSIDLLMLPDRTIRSFALGNTTTNYISEPTTGATASASATLVTQSISASPMTTTDHRKSTRSKLSFVEDPNLANRCDEVAPMDDDESLVKTPPPTNTVVSVKPKGTPYRSRFVSSSDDDDHTLKDNTSEMNNGDDTFTLDEKTNNLPAVINKASNERNGGAYGPDTMEWRSTAFSAQSQNMQQSIVPIGRPSMPASRLPPRVQPRVHEAEDDVFKKPPLPERFTSKAKMMKPNDHPIGEARPKVVVENQTRVRKPSVNFGTTRHSPLMRSPSQSSLTKEDTPPITNGKGLRHTGSMKNLRKWNY